MTHNNLDPEALEVALEAYLSAERNTGACSDEALVAATITAYLAHIRARSLSDLAAADAVFLDGEPT